MKKKVGPIKPSQVGTRKQEDFPPEVFEAFNELIARNFANGRAIVRQEEVVKLIKKKGLKGDIFENHWLDVEEAYMAAGWKVLYDKPAHNESYEATFTFIRR
jgi:hypothetical protein